MNSDYPSLLAASMRMTLLVPHKFIYLRQEKSQSIPDMVVSRIAKLYM